VRGLQQALAARYDLIILELRWPQIDGREVLARVLRGLPQQAVLVLSLVADVSTKVECSSEQAAAVRDIARSVTEPDIHRRCRHNRALQRGARVTAAAVAPAGRLNGEAEWARRGT
jgi:CheY-like chemotaxis protein